MNKKKQPKELTTEQLAKRWSLSPDTLANWRAMGRGPAYIKKPFGKVRVTYQLHDVIEYENKETKITAN